MRKYLRDNSKKLLAVASVVLMVAWFLPQKNRPNMNTSHPVGSFGDQKVFDTDLRVAKDQWSLLTDYVMYSPENNRGEEISLLRGAVQREPYFRLLFDEMNTHPEVFFLLQKEAEQMGVLITDAQAEGFIKQAELCVRLNTTARQIIPYDQVNDPVYKAGILEAVKAYLRVRENFQRAATTLKVSKPMRDLRLQQQLQEIQVSVVEFNGSDYFGKINPPTPEQLQEQFNRYANFLPNPAGAPNNPFGFGYMYPDRVTLQYIGVRHDDVVNSIRATKSAYDWDVEAQKYYQRNLKQFEIATPATQPSTNPTTNPAAASLAPSTAPTVKPFADVKQEILDRVMANDVRRRADDAMDRIKVKLTEDWKTWSTAHPGALSMPTTSPSQPVASAPSTAAFAAGDYGSYEYLQQLADDVEKHTHVRPVIGAINQYEGADELEKIRDIGLATINQASFPQYATMMAADIVPPQSRDNSTVLKLYQPSSLLHDAVGSTYIFRLTGAKPASKPESMSEVAAAVERDDRIARAYALAQKNAQELQQAAAESGSLSSAAVKSGLKPIVTGMFNIGSAKIDGLDLDAKALPKFRLGAFSLLSIPATRPSAAAIKSIEIPLAQKIEVTQLVAAKPRIDPSNLAMFDEDVNDEVMRDMAAPIVYTWFDYNSVIERMKYKDDTPKNPKKPPA